MTADAASRARAVGRMLFSLGNVLTLFVTIIRIIIDYLSTASASIYSLVYLGIFTPCARWQALITVQRSDAASWQPSKDPRGPFNCDDITTILGKWSLQIFLPTSHLRLAPTLPTTYCTLSLARNEVTRCKMIRWLNFRDCRKRYDIWLTSQAVIGP